MRKLMMGCRSAQLLMWVWALPISAIIVLASMASTADAQTVPIHPRVVWTENPQSEAVVVWDTMDPAPTNAIYYDTQPRNGVMGDYAFFTPAYRNNKYASWQYNPSYHHAILQNLQPNTTYYFVLESDGNVSVEYQFKTAPNTDVPFRLIVGGDSRSDSVARRAINERIKALAEADPGILALIHGGDYVDNGVSIPEWMEWLDDHDLILMSNNRLLPIVPTRGNHEALGEVYDEIFGFPGGVGKNYFNTKFTPMAMVITLNTNISLGGNQGVFLESVLSDNDYVRWQLPNYHIPAWPAVKGPGSALQFFVPVFEQFNVDLVLESDGHALKRTVPIRNNQQDPTGIIYIGEGGFGVPQRTPNNAGLWYLQSPGMTMESHHVMVLSFTAQTLTTNVYSETGTLLDSFTLNARSRPAPPGGGNNGGGNNGGSGGSGGSTKLNKKASCTVGEASVITGWLVVLAFIMLLMIRGGVLFPPRLR